MSRAKTILLVPMGALYVLAGLNHFWNESFYLQIMPPWMPWHGPLVAISGIVEVMLGAAVLLPWTRRAAAWGLVAMLVAVFPANVHMALADVHVDGAPVGPPWALWVRLPIQGLLILWAFWYTRGPAQPLDNAPEPGNLPGP